MPMPTNNQNQTSPVLKPEVKILKFNWSIVVAVVLTLLISGGGVYAWQYFVSQEKEQVIQQLQQQVTTLNYQVDQSKVQQDSNNQDQENQQNNQNNSELKIFTSKFVNLSFNYPNNSEYQENESNESKTGQAIYFTDKNNIAPTFEAITKDYTGKISPAPATDIIEGDLSSESSFKVVNIFANDKFTKIIKKAPGVYQVIGYFNMECSPAIDSYLIVVTPLTSNLKYIKFYLSNTYFLSDEVTPLPDPCVPKNESIITNKIDSILNGEVPEVQKNLDSALKIAETFKLSTNSDMISGIKNAFAAKYNKSFDQIQITIEKSDDSHIRGNVRFGSEPGEGGYFFAAKVNGNWQIVIDGNGQISCGLLNSYNFPASMTTDCVNP